MDRKVVILGPRGVEVEFLLRSLALVHGEQEVQVAEVAGCQVYRTEISVTASDGRDVSLSLFAASIGADFRSIYSLLFEGARGAIALIPADTSRVNEGRQVLGVLQSQFLSRADPEDRPTYLLQYQWRKEHLNLSAEVIDESFGVNPAAVKRVLTQFNDMSQIQGLQELVEMMVADAAIAKV